MLALLDVFVWIFQDADTQEYNIINYLHIVSCFSEWWGLGEALWVMAVHENLYLSSVLVCLSVDIHLLVKTEAQNKNYFLVPTQPTEPPSPFIPWRGIRPAVFWLCLTLCGGQSCSWQNCGALSSELSERIVRGLVPQRWRKGKWWRQKRPPKTQQIRVVSIASEKSLDVFI